MLHYVKTIYSHLKTENPLVTFCLSFFWRYCKKCYFWDRLHVLVHLRNGFLNSAQNFGLETFVRTFGPRRYNKTLLSPPLQHFLTVVYNPIIGEEREVVNLMMVADLTNENVNCEWKIWLCNKKIVFYTFIPTWWTYSITYFKTI